MSGAQRCLRVVLLVTVASLGWAVRATAQTDADINASIQFDFSVPGARSLAMGGAFLATADDATAAFTNPAGLTNLHAGDNEVSVEGRQWRYTNSYVVAGREFGTPVGIGVDNRDSLVLGKRSDDTSGLSFVSAAFPRARWSAAIYRHELANFEASAVQDGAFFGLTNGPSARIFPVQSHLDLTIDDYGGSFAVRVGDKLSLGVGVGYYSFDLSSFGKRYSTNLHSHTEPLNQQVDLGETFGPVNFDESNVVSVQTFDGSEHDVAGSAGFLWKPTAKWSIGGVYRQGPSFDFATHFAPGPAASFTPVDARAKFHVPDSYGLGIAFHPIQDLVVSAQWDRVQYSDMSGSTIDIFAQPLPIDRLVADDADEVRLGFEYFFSQGRIPWAVRGGAWRDPEHRVHFEGTPGNDPASLYLATLFQKGKQETHYCAGVGAVFGKFQLDAAADWSDPVRTVSLSSVFRF